MWKLQEEERELDLGSEELDPPLPPTVTSRVISKFLFFYSFYHSVTFPFLRERKCCYHVNIVKGKLKFLSFLIFSVLFFL